MSMLAIGRKWSGSFAAFALLAMAPPSVTVAQSGSPSAPAAEVDMLIGSATASPPDGLIRGLQKGDRVYPGELVASYPNSYVNLEYGDGSFTLLRPNSRLLLETYRFVAEPDPAPAAPPAAPSVPAPPAPAPVPTPPVAPRASAPTPAAPARKPGAAAPAPPPAIPAPTPPPIVRKPTPPSALPDRSAARVVRAAPESRSVLRLVKGGLRAVTGLIGRETRTQYQVLTPVATIGIRGTDFLAAICDAACAADPVVGAELSDVGLAEGGLIASTYEGLIGVESKGRHCDGAGASGPCEVGPGQALLVDRNGNQYRLRQLPRYLAVDPMPDPRTCGL